MVLFEKFEALFFDPYVYYYFSRLNLMTYIVKFRYKIFLIKFYYLVYNIS